VKRVSVTRVSYVHSALGSHSLSRLLPNRISHGPKNALLGQFATKHCLEHIEAISSLLHVELLLSEIESVGHLIDVDELVKVHGTIVVHVENFPHVASQPNQVLQDWCVDDHFLGLVLLNDAIVVQVMHLEGQLDVDVASIGPDQVADGLVVAESDLAVSDAGKDFPQLFEVGLVVTVIIVAVIIITTVIVTTIVVTIIVVTTIIVAAIIVAAIVVAAIIVAVISVIIACRIIVANPKGSWQVVIAHLLSADDAIVVGIHGIENLNDFFVVADPEDLLDGIVEHVVEIGHAIVVWVYHASELLDSGPHRLFNFGDPFVSGRLLDVGYPWRSDHIEDGLSVSHGSLGVICATKCITEFLYGEPAIKVSIDSVPAPVEVVPLALVLSDPAYLCVERRTESSLQLIFAHKLSVLIFFICVPSKEVLDSSLNFFLIDASSAPSKVDSDFFSCDDAVIIGLNLFVEFHKLFPGRLAVLGNLEFVFLEGKSAIAVLV